MVNRHYINHHLRSILFSKHLNPQKQKNHQWIIFFRIRIFGRPPSPNDSHYHQQVTNQQKTLNNALSTACPTVTKTSTAPVWGLVPLCPHRWVFPRWTAPQEPGAVEKGRNKGTAQVRWATVKKPGLPYFPVESRLVNRDPYFMVYEIILI